jgi:hypothetical protein
VADGRNDGDSKRSDRRKTGDLSKGDESSKREDAGANADGVRSRKGMAEADED